MAGEDQDKIWTKLDQIATQTVDTRLAVERMAGDQRAAHAEFKGNLTSLSQRLEDTEKNQSKQLTGLDKRVTLAEGDIDTLKGAKQYSAGRAAGLSAAVAGIIAVLVEVFKSILPH